MMRRLTLHRVTACMLGFVTACAPGVSASSIPCSSAQSVLVAREGVATPSLTEGSGGFLEFEVRKAGPLDTNMETVRCSVFAESIANKPDSLRLWTATHCLSPARTEKATLYFSTVAGYVPVPIRWELVERAHVVRKESEGLPVSLRERLLGAFESPELLLNKDPFANGGGGKYLCASILGLAEAEIERVLTMNLPISSVPIQEVATTQRICATARDMTAIDVTMAADPNPENKKRIDAVVSAHVARHAEERTSFESKLSAAEKETLSLYRHQLNFWVFSNWLQVPAYFLWADDRGNPAWTLRMQSQNIPEPMDFREFANGTFSLLQACEQGATNSLCPYRERIMTILASAFPKPAEIALKLQEFQNFHRCMEALPANGTEYFRANNFNVIGRFGPDEIKDSCIKAGLVLREIQQGENATGIGKFAFFQRAKALNMLGSGSSETLWMTLVNRPGAARLPFHSGDTPVRLNTNLAKVVAASPADLTATAGSGLATQFLQLPVPQVWTNRAVAANGSYQFNGGFHLAKNKAMQDLYLQPGDSGAIFTVGGIPLAAVNSVDGTPSSGGLVLRPLPQPRDPNQQGSSGSAAGDALQEPKPSGSETVENSMDAEGADTIQPVTPAVGREGSNGLRCAF